MNAATATGDHVPPAWGSARISRLEVTDVRFPTSLSLDGSDAMNRDPDYSAAYVVLHTDDPAAPTGHGFTFTTGRGTEVVVAGVEAIRPLIMGRSVAEMRAGMGALWSDLVGDSQLRWIGPEKGVIHLALAAVVNAAWDLVAKAEGKPLWRLLADMTPEEIVECIDFRYIDDAITPDEVAAVVERNHLTMAEREAALRSDGYPAYTTSAGWLGYADEKMRGSADEALAAGFTRFKMKVGADLDDDIRRWPLIREDIGPERRLAMDANQRWDVAEAIEWVNALADSSRAGSRSRPARTTSSATPRSRGPSHPIQVATGEHVHNRVMFKQLLQAERHRLLPDRRRRLGGVNEVLAILLLAAKFGVPVCPHAGGVGPVRVRAAPLDLRLSRGQRLARGAHDRVRRPPARALRRPCRHARRELHLADATGL